MGLFDYVTCRYSVPGVEDIGKIEFQSYDTDSQYLEQYLIREDGTIWKQVYDARWEHDDSAPAKVRLHKDNLRWRQEKTTGEIEISGGNYSIQFWFRDGIVKDVVVNELSEDG